MVLGYKKLKLLGEGTFGKVYLVESEHGHKAALKEIKGLNEDSIEEAKAEADMLYSLDHQNIIRFKELQITPDNIYIITEYAAGGSLQGKIDKLEQKNARFEEVTILRWMKQLCRALKYIHSKNIIHRDLKPANILLSEERAIKVADMGISRILESSSEYAQTFAGTKVYMSPEMHERKPYNFKADIWSFGVILYQLWTLKFPFKTTSDIVNVNYPPLKKDVPTIIEVLISRSLVKDPHDRATANELLSLIKQGLKKSPEVKHGAGLAKRPAEELKEHMLLGKKAVAKEEKKKVEEQKQIAKPKPPRKYFCMVYDQNAYLFDPVTLQQVQVSRHNTPNISRLHSISIMTSDEKVFITGSAASLRQTLEFVITEWRMVKKADMLSGRLYHALVEFKGKYIIAVAGSIVAKTTDWLRDSIKECEAYDIARNQWLPIAPLNAVRTAHTTFQHRDKYIYVFGGFHGGDMERIELDSNLKGKWELLNIKLPSIQSPAGAVASAAMNEDEILIFGYASVQGNKTNEGLIFNCKTQQMSQYPYLLPQVDLYMIGSAVFMSAGGRYHIITVAGHSVRYDGVKWEHKSWAYKN